MAASVLPGLLPFSPPIAAARPLQPVLWPHVCLAGGAFVAYLLASGGVYFFSARYPEPTFALFLERIGIHYPRYLGNLALCVGIVAILHAGLASWFKRQQSPEVRT